ncbi:hypothetical protein JWS13_37570 [Rhodococcus pseudokoreensis]|uniref:Uncharacterized protein n=1 Tax=Rhodococcus pseudokoreensis TaxID=2811421 RepID=A0A974WAS6_9NOCA|nr:DUF6339 family protein [Rhodococcus pseudokoreensis]QSE93907.1 hypothetical protein JWS13_37570 [Rhodococcus pseudokoreensis]
MTYLWPRLSAAFGTSAFDKFSGKSVSELKGLARDHHAHVTYAATGGTRVTKSQAGALAEKLREIGEAYGYPEAPNNTQRIGFDRAAAELIYTTMDITSVEASNRGVWNFLSIVTLPDLTMWRFEDRNIERWIARDLTRHMFSRLWWQGMTFAIPTPDGPDFSLLRALTESDLNQITERRSLGGNPRLAQALARIVTESEAGGGRRELIRDVTPALRRMLAFVDFSTLSNDQIDDHVRELISRSVARLRV